MEKASQGKLPFWLILAISLVVPGLVAFLFLTPGKLNLGDFVYTLPHFHGVINSLTSVVLIAALIAVKNGNLDWHRNLMLAAISMGALFLVSYVIYHASVEPIKFGDANHDGVVDADISKGLRLFYVILLVSHIVLSAGALPLILSSLFFALKQRFETHKKWVRWAYPVWLYVSITGVIVYWMMRPYYF